MSTITRQLPRTVASRLAAIRAAKTKRDNPGSAGNFLTANTNTRVLAIKTSYEAANTAVNNAQAVLSANTPLKNVAVAAVKMYCSHFIQVFNLGVTRGDFVAAHRSYYGLDVDSDALPEMITEAQIMDVAQNLINGDPVRVLAGGAAMSLPTIAQVTTKRTAASTLLISQSNLKDTLDTAQEALAALNVEADKVIKKVWDEVETFYNEEDAASIRENAVEWGVYYVTVGEQTNITGKVTSSAGTTPVEAHLLFVNSDNEVDANDAGDYAYTTTYIGDEIIHVTAPGYQPKDVPFTISEGDDRVVNVALDPL